MSNPNNDALINRFTAGDVSAINELKALLDTPQLKLAFGVFYGLSADRSAAAFDFAFKLFSNPELFKERFEYAKQNISVESIPPIITQEELDKHSNYSPTESDRNQERALLELGLNPTRAFFINHQLKTNELGSGFPLTLP